MSLRGALTGMWRPQLGDGSNVASSVLSRARSAAINLFEVVALVAVALFLLVGIVVAALRPAPLLGLFLGRLRPPAHLPALAAGVTLWTEVRATWGHVTAAAPPALCLVLCLGLLRRSGLDCSVTLRVRRNRWKEKKNEAC